jgi:hypothetical protein
MESMNKYLKAAGLISLVKRINTQLQEFGLQAEVTEIPQEQPKQSTARVGKQAAKLSAHTESLLKAIQAHAVNGVASRSACRKACGRISGAAFGQRLRRLVDLKLVSVDNDLIRLK